ncbi:anti-sigma factor [Brumimicrobium aurantiacum]|uniref:Anti-sigma K factor RskA C-terminal domain-containing protein n=1 Tax=Brumimicrobium aurantiacum TaxID=1737063 RepID=A0A3E1EYN5_9FLAO|nr:anti-sigma factor [Brumimicrobium aurantiacum]RFC54593.1 hypothetical protein DXU93_06280 [Brumimicrobium aurantiacum]
MDIKEYIASGILERFVLGDISEQERQEVACLTKIYPELQEELFAHQKGVEQMVSKYATTPPVKLKSEILSKIKDIPQENLNSNNNEGKVVMMNNSTSNRFKYIAAACSVALFISIGTGLYLNNENSELQGDITANNSMLKELIEKNDELASKNEKINSKFNLVTNSSTSKITMKGTENQPQSLASIFVSGEDEQLYLQVNNLPEITESNDYQLWAIVDGKPKSLGVFNSINEKDLLEMDYYANAQAYAVTLEPKGGSESPTMEQMYVYGGV